MASRRDVSKAIGRAAFAAELKEDSRAKAWSGAAWTVSQAEGDFAALVEAGLDSLPGIDEDLAAWFKQSAQVPTVLRVDSRGEGEDVTEPLEIAPRTVEVDLVVREDAFKLEKGA